MHLVTQTIPVQTQCRPVRHSHVQRHVFAVLNFLHRLVRMQHQLIGKTQSPVSSEDGEGGDVAMHFSLLL